ncbi:hypothetical protein BD413DRAFT_3906 [Trametes elegans]|nr:hypothetical protein BD413DRAFT_3906 [Trametes elegans]
MQGWIGQAVLQSPASGVEASAPATRPWERSWPRTKRAAVNLTNPSKNARTEGAGHDSATGQDTHQPAFPEASQRMPMGPQHLARGRMHPPASDDPTPLAIARLPRRDPNRAYVTLLNRPRLSSTSRTSAIYTGPRTGSLREWMVTRWDAHTHTQRGGGGTCARAGRSTVCARGSTSCGVVLGLQGPWEGTCCVPPRTDSPITGAVERGVRIGVQGCNARPSWPRGCPRIVCGRVGCKFEHCGLSCRSTVSYSTSYRSSAVRHRRRTRTV